VDDLAHGPRAVLYALFENPGLVDAVIEKVAKLIYSVVEDLMEETERGRRVHGG